MKWKPGTIVVYWSSDIRGVNGELFRDNKVLRNRKPRIQVSLNWYLVINCWCIIIGIFKSFITGISPSQWESKSELSNMIPWDPVYNTTVNEAPSTKVPVITPAVDLPHTPQTGTNIAFVKQVRLVTHVIEFSSSSIFSNRRPSKFTPQSVT